MLAVKDTGMKPHHVSAVASVTSGLATLADTNAPIPLELLKDWRREVNNLSKAWIRRFSQEQIRSMSKR
jgi:hypothetical protein